MSRGPGRIERAIEKAFTGNPSCTFTSEELVAAAYPDATIAKRHRVAVLRAAAKVAKRTWWRGYRQERLAGQIIYYNHLSLRSYAMARLQTCFLLHNDDTLVEMEAEIAPGGRSYKHVEPETGSWWQHVERYKAEATGDAERMRYFEAKKAERARAYGIGLQR